MGLLLLASRVLAGEPEKPNIVLILADDLGWNALHCTGNKAVDTPNLDRLAAQGMRFSHAYAEPQCSPTRAALLSGQWGARTGMFRVTTEKPPRNPPLIPGEAATALPPSVATLAQDLKRAGYATGLSGKWHIADNYNAAPLKKRPGYFASYGFDFVGEAANDNDKSVTGITDDMLGFIEANKAHPFFAFVAHHAPHTPMEAPKALVDKYIARGFKKSSSPVCILAERPTADYLAMLEHLDTSVGKILTKLDALKLSQNTLVIFASDNGGLGRMADMAPLRDSKGAPYEGGIRVPLFMRWPGRIKPGSQSAFMTHTVDLYPTLLELARAKTEKRLDGVSLAPFLLGKGTRPTRDTLFWHLPTYTPMYARTPCSSVRQGDWKLVHYYGDFLDPTGATPGNNALYGKLILGERWELYNLKDDPEERRNCVASEPKRVAALKRLLEVFLKETSAALPKNNPRFDPKDPDWWKTSN